MTADCRFRLRGARGERWERAVLVRMWVKRPGVRVRVRVRGRRVMVGVWGRVRRRTGVRRRAGEM